MLKKFRDMVAGGSGDNAVKQPPYVIKAGDLDKNFELCHPLPVDGNNAAYTIDRSVAGGFRLRGQSRAEDAADVDSHVRRNAQRRVGRREKAAELL